MLVTQFRPGISCHSASKGSINNLVYTIQTVTSNVTVFNTVSLIDDIVYLLGTVCTKLIKVVDKTVLIFQNSHHVESASIPCESYVNTSKTKFRRISTLFLHTIPM